MSDELTPAESEEQTSHFLKTNGPPPGIFKPDVPYDILEGASKRERYLLEMAAVGARQNEYLIAQDAGKKAALRSIIARLADGDKRMDAIQAFAASTVKAHEESDNKAFAEIRAALQPFTDFRKKYIGGKRLALTLIVLPAMSILLVEYIKHLLHW